MIFISYTWQDDVYNRKNADRVRKLSTELKNIGWDVWIDCDKMYGNIDSCIASGIDSCDACIICLTEQYFCRVDCFNSVCKKEFIYSDNRDKIIIPVIMEKTLLNTKEWPNSILTMRFGNHLYVDASTNDMTKAAFYITKQLSSYSIFPTPRKIIPLCYV